MDRNENYVDGKFPSFLKDHDETAIKTMVN